MEETTVVIRQSSRKVTVSNVIDAKNELNSSTKRTTKSAASKSSKIASEVQQSETKNEKASRNRKAANQSKSENVSEKIQSSYINGNTLHTSLINGDNKSDHSVYKFYKDAGEFWNKFPKTDYTYSRYSPHRKEVAPGVMAIPNMSRRSLHSEFDGDTPISNQRFYEYENLIRNRRVITNNEDETIRRRTYYHTGVDEIDFQKETIIHKILRYTGIIFIYSLITKIVSKFYQSNTYYTSQRSVYTQKNWFWRTWDKISSAFYRVFSTFYTMLCSAMIFDRRILRLINRETTSMKSVLLLAVLPPLIFGVLWLLLKTVHWFDTDSSWMASTSEEPLISLPSMTFPSINPFSLLPSISLFSFPSFSSSFFSSEASNSKLVLTEDLMSEIHQIVDFAVAKKLKEIESKTSYNDQVKSMVEDSQKAYLINQNENLKKLESKFNLDLSQGKVTTEEHKLLINQLQNRVDNVFNDISKIELLKSQYEDLVGKVEGLNVKIVDNEHKSGNQISLQLKQCCETNLEEIKAIVHSQFVSWDSEKGSKLQDAVELLKEKLNLILVSIEDNKLDIDALKDDRSQVNTLREELLKLREDITAFMLAKPQIQTEINVADEHIEKIINAALHKYDADKTGRADFALEPSGGQVLSTRCTESYNIKTAVFSVWGFPLWTASNTPRVVINRGAVPGECWAFQGFPGFLVLKLSHLIQISGFSMEHIPKQLAPTGHIDSAPKNFSVYGLQTENDADPYHLGNFLYDEAGEPVQFFPVEQTKTPVFQIVELRIESNHGNINFTCLYRFRVHGTIVKKYRRR